VQRGLHSVVAASRLVPVHDRQARQVAQARQVVKDRTVSAHRRSLIGRLGHDRVAAIAVVGILIGASIVSISAGHTVAAANTGGTTGAGVAPRLAVGGPPHQASTGVGNVEFGDPTPAEATQDRFSPIDFGYGSVGPVERSEPATVEGSFSEDGTLIKPTAVDTTVADGSALVTTYKVKAGDTLVGIANKYRVSTMSVWWANNLKSKTDLRVGEVLRIPPVTGLIVSVTATDTLDAIAARYHVNSLDILATNGIDDPNLVVGQVLVIPGAKGAAIPVPKPPTAKTSTKSSSGGSARPPSSYSGGKFLWPVVGGGNYISQYFHYGHYAIDIAADYGSTVRAAAAGTVQFAGWKNNGGGYQVWIAHGSGLYTTYNHMSAITVGAGQRVARGQQVGRIGQSGDATGPHCHFEVWRGPIWNGGTRVNPLAYF
jgi:murein DD-endopeptidase MepM/ murein hydrolase activator NlpD